MKFYYSEGFIIIETEDTRYKTKAAEVLKVFKIENSCNGIDFLLNLLKRYYLLNPEEFLSKLESPEIDLISDLLQHPYYSKELDIVYKEAYKTQIQNIFDKHNTDKDAILKDITELFK